MLRKPLISSLVTVQSLILFAVLNGLGCASISGNRQLVAIDSTPRGVDVYLEGETKPIGQTPLIYRMQRTPNEDLRFVGADGKSLSVHHECGYRWTLQLVGNGLFIGGFFGWPGALTALAIDFATGAAFDCGAKIVGALPAGTPVNAAKCHSLAIVPLDHWDPATAEKLADVWMTQNNSSLRRCDRYLSYAISENALASVNVGKLSGRSWEELEPRFRYRVADELGATHFVDLLITETKTSWRLNPVVYDAVTGKVAEDLPGELRPAETPKVIETHWAPTWFASWTANLLPNAIAWQPFALGGSGVEAVSGYSLGEVTNKGKSRISPYVAIAAYSVEHPNGYDAWDYGVSFSPTIDLQRRDLKAQVTDAEDVQSHWRIKSTQLIGAYELSLSGHTPIGAFSIAYGLGYFVGNQSIEDKNMWDHGGVSTASLSYTAFLTDNVFFRTRSSTIKTDNGKDDRVPLYLDSESSSVAVEIGYFFPRMGRFARSLL